LGRLGESWKKERKGSLDESIQRGMGGHAEENMITHDNRPSSNRERASTSSRNVAGGEKVAKRDKMGLHPGEQERGGLIVGRRCECGGPHLSWLELHLGVENDKEGEK